MTGEAWFALGIAAGIGASMFVVVALVIISFIIDPAEHPHVDAWID